MSEDKQLEEKDFKTSKLIKNTLQIFAEVLLFQYLDEIRLNTEIDTKTKIERMIAYLQSIKMKLESKKTTKYIS